MPVPHLSFQSSVPRPASATDPFLLQHLFLSITSFNKSEQHSANTSPSSGNVGSLRNGVSKAKINPTVHTRSSHRCRDARPRVTEFLLGKGLGSNPVGTSDPDQCQWKLEKCHLGCRRQPVLSEGAWGPRKQQELVSLPPPQTKIMNSKRLTLN